jgi:short-subunit dehydrogenase
VPRLRKSLHVEFVAVPADLSDFASVETVLSACGDRDVGVVLLNAGYGPFGLIENTPNSKIESTIGLMCTSYALLSRAFLARNRDRGDPFLVYITSSLAADYIVPLQTLYCSAKAYLTRLGKSLAVELAGTNARITVMQPGCFASSGFFSSGIRTLVNVAFPPSERIARAVIASLGRADVVDCTANSGLFRAMGWAAGDIPIYALGRSLRHSKASQSSSTRGMTWGRPRIRIDLARIVAAWIKRL